MKQLTIQFAALLLAMAGLQGLGAQPSATAAKAESLPDIYQYRETRELVQLVNDAADLLQAKGPSALEQFRVTDSRWRQGETYIFVLDPKGNMLVHSDPAMEGKNHLDLKDINGKPIVRGLISAVTTFADKPEGWYHYQWQVPGGLLPRWKSTYVRLVKIPSGPTYIVGSGVYNDRMEKSFVIDAVKDAVAHIEKEGKSAFQLFRDPKGPFIAKDAYIFVLDMNGVELVNPGFPNLEGRSIVDLKDIQGKPLLREMLDVVQRSGAGWMNYEWPKPGESVPTLKSTYVSKAKMGEKELLVGCGVYLEDAPKAIPTAKKLTAPELMALVRDGAALLESQGEKAYAEFRKKGSKWFSDDTYLFVRTMQQKSVFHAADPSREGRDLADIKDVLGRPYGKMFHQAALSPSGEGWVHYMYPEPGSIFPTWKSTFIKRVTFPSGKEHLVGCGIYNMDMDEAFIQDVVDRAAALIEKRGKKAFPELRDKKGPYVFMETYVFVQQLDGTELVNAAQPSLEGKNLIAVKDLNGKLVVKECIEIVTQKGSGWLDYYWYKPGQNTPARKHTYVKRAEFDNVAYVVGSGYYPREQEMKAADIQKTSWNTVKHEKLSDSLSRQAIFGEKGTVAQFEAKRGATIARHSHPYEEYSAITSGSVQYLFDDRNVQLATGDVLVVPAHTPHSVQVLEDATFVDFFAPARADWLRGEDRYLRN